MKSYDKLEDVKKLLTGYNMTEYKPTQFDADCVITCFQYCERDEVGKKYFIDAKVWDYSFTDRIPENFCVEYQGQYYQKGTHEAFNITFIDWTFEQVKAFIDDLFDKRIIEYYEIGD